MPSWSEPGSVKLAPLAEMRAQAAEEVRSNAPLGLPVAFDRARGV
jgi:hypothetical protein